MWQGTLVCIVRGTINSPGEKYVILSTSGTSMSLSVEQLRDIISKYPDCLSNVVLRHDTIEVTQGEYEDYLCGETDYDRCLGVEDALNGYTFNPAIPIITCRIENIDGKLLGYRVALYVDGEVLKWCHNPEAVFNLVNSHDFANAYIKDGKVHILGKLDATLRESTRGTIMGLDIMGTRGNIEYRTKPLEPCYSTSEKGEVIEPRQSPTQRPVKETVKEPKVVKELDLDKLIQDIDKVEKWAEEENETSFVLRL